MKQLDKDGMCLLRAKAWRAEIRLQVSKLKKREMTYWEVNKVANKLIPKKNKTMELKAYEVRLDKENLMWKLKGTRKQVSHLFEIFDLTEDVYNYGPEGSYLFEALEMKESKNNALLKFANIIGTSLDKLIELKLNPPQLFFMLDYYPQFAFDTFAFAINRFQIQRLLTQNDDFIFYNVSCMLENEILKRKLKKYSLDGEKILKLLNYRGGHYVQKSAENSITQYVDVNLDGRKIKLPLYYQLDEMKDYGTF